MTTKYDIGDTLIEIVFTCVDNGHVDNRVLWRLFHPFVVDEILISKNKNEYYDSNERINIPVKNLFRTQIEAKHECDRRNGLL